METNSQNRPLETGVVRYQRAGRIASVAMGEKGDRKGFRKSTAEDDPLAWWILTEIIADGMDVT